MTPADEARRIAVKFTVIANEAEITLESCIAAALAAAERRGVERAASEAENFLVLIGAGWRKFPHNSSDGKARERMCVDRIRALLPESSGISGELPAEPAAKCGMGLTLVFVGTNGELPPQELHPVAKCATCGAQHPAHHSCTPAMDPPKCATCGSKGKVVDTVQATHVSGRGHENLITYQPCPACAVGGGK